MSLVHSRVCARARQPANPSSDIIQDAMSTLGCAQCGRPLPSDAAELARWAHGDLAASGEIDETAAGMLLCPDCAEDDLLGEYEEGEAG